MSLADDLSEESAQREADERREARRLTAAIREREAVIADLRKRLDLVTAIDQARIKPPRWLVPPRNPRDRRGTVCAMLTDTHFGEVVDPAEIEGLNAYNDDIAEQRVRRFAEKSVRLARDYVSGITYDGAVLAFGGDIFTGTIHDELTETNAETLYESVVHWLDPISAVIHVYLDAFGKVHIPCTFGNHGRRTRKPRAKQRAQDNIEWVFYRVLEREFRGDKRVTWAISEGADTRFSIYSTRFDLTHGDQFRGGAGIAGMFSPLMLGQHRKTRRALTAGHPYDVLLMGHWHSYWNGKGIIVGGTLKGYDEYAYVSNFDWEPPQQAFWVTTPDHGVTIAAPIHVMDREAEGW